MSNRVDTVPIMQGQETPSDAPPAYEGTKSGPPPQYQQYPTQGYPTAPPNGTQGYPSQQYGSVPTQQIPVPVPFPTVQLRTILGKNPQELECMYCHSHVVTSTRKIRGNMNWLVAACVCLAVMPLTWLGCACIPLCMDSLKDVEHTCPNCNKVLGVWTQAS